MEIQLHTFLTSALHRIMRPSLRPSNLNPGKNVSIPVYRGVRGGAFGWGTALQAGRSRVWFAIFGIFDWHPSGRIMTVGLTKPLTEMSTRNISWWVKATLPPSCAVVTKSENLNLLEPSGPVQACNGNVLTFYLFIGGWISSRVGLDAVEESKIFWPLLEHSSAQPSRFTDWGIEDNFCLKLLRKFVKKSETVFICPSTPSTAFSALMDKNFIFTPLSDFQEISILRFIITQQLWGPGFRALFPSSVPPNFRNYSSMCIKHVQAHRPLNNAGLYVSGFRLQKYGFFLSRKQSIILHKIARAHIYSAFYLYAAYWKKLSVATSDYIASNYRIISEWRTGRDIEQNDRGPL